MIVLPQFDTGNIAENESESDAPLLLTTAFKTTVE